MSGSMLLTFGVKSEEFFKLKMLCARHKVRLRAVEPGEGGCTLEQLLEKQASPADVEPEEGIEEPMLVMAGFSQTLLYAFLQDFRRFGIRPIALKAVLTPTNASWKPADLYRELCAERTAFQNGESAHKVDGEQ